MANNKHNILNVPLSLSTNLDTLKIQGEYLNENDGYITNGTLSGFEKKDLPYSNLIVDPTTNDNYYVEGKVFYKNGTPLKTFRNFGVSEETIGTDYFDWYSEDFYLTIEDRQVKVYCHGQEHLVASDIDQSSFIQSDLHLHWEKTYLAMVSIPSDGCYLLTFDTTGNLISRAIRPLFGSDNPRVYITSFETKDYMFMAIFGSNPGHNSQLLTKGDGTRFYNISTGTVYDPEARFETAFYYKGKQVANAARQTDFYATKASGDFMEAGSMTNDGTYMNFPQRVKFLDISVDGYKPSGSTEDIYTTWGIYELVSCNSYGSFAGPEGFIPVDVSVQPYSVRNKYTYVSGIINNDTNWMYPYRYVVDPDIRNGYGSRAFSDGWCIHSNSAIISAVSIAEDYDTSGTLIEGWNIWDSDFVPKVTAKGLVIKKAGSGDIVRLYRNDTIKTDFWNDRFIVFNTFDYENAFDIRTQKFTRYASDYSNTCIPRGAYNGADYIPTATVIFTDGTSDRAPGQNLTNSTPTTFPCTTASGYNVSPEKTENPLVGLSLNPITGNNAQDFGEWPVTSPIDMRGIPSKGDIIDAYVSKEILSVAPPYYITIENNNYNIRGSLEGTVFPIEKEGNIQYNVGLGAEIIDTTTNNDVVRIGDRSYPLIYQNLSPIFAYTLKSFVENVDVSFAIYGTTYSIISNKITLVTYNNGVVSSTTPIVDVSGLIFLGFDPNTAYFFNQNTKYIYTFTGDRVLQPLQSASGISKVIGYAYSPATTVLSVLSDYGVTNLANGTVLSHFPLKDGTKVTTTDNSIIVESESGTTQYIYDQKEPGNLLKFSTPFVGVGGPTVCVIDCWYLRVYSETKVTTIKSKITTLTDKATSYENKEFKLKPSDFDEFSTAYIRIQPKYQRGTGAKLDLEITDGSIVSLNYGITTENASQITRYNI